MNGKFVLAKNALANVARGSTAALVAVILPVFLSRLMSPDAYGAWLFVLQLSAFIGYLDFGIQTAIGRFVARTNEQNDSEHRDRILNTALFALAVAGGLGLLGSCGLAALLPWIFHQVPKLLLGDVRLALVLIGSSLALGLPFSIFNGIFIGLQRYEIPAVTVAGSRVVSAFCVVLLAMRGATLVQMGAAVATINLVSYAIQYLAYKVSLTNVDFSIRLVSRQTGRELRDYCLGLSVWSFAMLLVGGLDVSLVGYFEFKKVVYYAVAATLITFLTGAQNAVFHVMIPSAAVLQARGDSSQLGQMVITATRYGAFIVLATGLPLVLGGRYVLLIWLGPVYAMEGLHLLQILAAANMIRLSAVPYAMTLIGTGQQKLVVFTPLLEGFVNLSASLLAGYFYGAIGIALGTLVGGIVGFLGNIVYNMKRTSEIKFRIWDYVHDGLIRPLVCSMPVIFAALALRSLGSFSLEIAGVTTILTVLIFWQYGLIRPERQKLLAYCFALGG